MSSLEQFVLLASLLRYKVYIFTFCQLYSNFRFHTTTDQQQFRWLKHHSLCILINSLGTNSQGSHSLGSENFQDVPEPQKHFSRTLSYASDV